MTNNRIAVGSVVEGISGAGYVRTDADGLVLDPGDSPSIATGDIAAGAITTPKLADSAVTGPKIANASVDLDKLTTDYKDALALDSESQPDFTHLIGSANDGRSVIKMNGTGYDVWVPCGLYAFTRWQMIQSASGRDHRIRYPRVERWHQFAPILGKNATVTGSPDIFSTDTYWPTVAALFTSSHSSQVTLTGSGRLVLYYYARTSSGTINITVTSTNSLFDASDVVTSSATSAASDGPAWLLIADNLPHDTYTVTVAGAGGTATYPIAVGMTMDSNAHRVEPHNPLTNRVQVAPWRAFIMESSAYTVINEASGSVWHDGVHQTAGKTLNANEDYVYLGCKSGDTFDRVDMTFTTANTLVGGNTVAQYYNGTTWTALTVIADTMRQFTLPLGGNGYIQFAIPSDWTAVAVNGVTAKWIRLASSNMASSVQIATAWLRLVWNAPEVVMTVSAQDSEFEPVFNRSENPSDDDIGGGHGNITRTAFTLTVDGVDATTDLTAGKSLPGKSIEFSQTMNALTAEAGSTIGTISERHRFGGGGVSVQYILTASATITMSPWAYSAMFPIDSTTPFTHFDLFYRGQTVRAALPISGAQTDPAEVCGARFTSSSYPYSAGVLQRLPQTANFNWVYSVSKCFVYNSGSNIKFYSQTSDSTLPKSLTTGQKWSVDNFYFVAAI